MTDWWTTFYDDLYADAVLSQVDPATTQAAASFLVAQLGLDGGSCVFEQCCGHGRLSLALAARGVRVEAVERVASYVATARAAGAPRATFHCDDAFTFVPPRACDAAFNWATSFGYSDDVRNAQMLRSAWTSLRPGGRFALDYPNMPRVIAQLEPQMTSRRGNATVLRESRLDFTRGFLEQTWTFTMTDGRRAVRQGSTRLYTPDDLRALCEAQGFAGVCLFGDVDATPYTSSSPRCIVVCQKVA